MKSLQPVPSGLIVLVAAAVASSCVPSRGAAFDPVQRTILDRTGYDVKWHGRAIDDPAVGPKLKELLSAPLTVESAVEIALVNNRDLQAEFEGLGIGLAEVAGASVLSNPEVDASLRIPLEGSGNTVEIDAIQDVINLLTLPKRRGIATAKLEAARAAAIDAVLLKVAEVRAAFYDAQASEQVVELRRTVLAATQAQFTLTQELHEAGNVNDLALNQERALFGEAKLALVDAETSAVTSRERLTALLGLSGDDIRWSMNARLPDLPGVAVELGDLESVAVSNNVVLDRERWRIEAAAGTIGLAKLDAWLPHVGVGVSAERESSGDWAVGPALTVAIPLFDRNQGGRARAEAELRQSQHRYTATAVAVRAAVRAVSTELVNARARVVFIRDELIPVRTAVLAQTLRHYNAMDASPYALLQAKRDEIAAGVMYIEALRDYWLARAKVDALRAGALPDLTMQTKTATEIGASAGGH